MQMSDVAFNAVIQTLSSQRNSGLDAIVKLQAQIADQAAEIKTQAAEIERLKAAPKAAPEAAP